MQLVQWNPFREMDDLLKGVRAGWPSLGRNDAAPLADWAPAVDISEKEREYLVKAQLPGVSKDDVKVELQNGVLTVSGERRFEKVEKDEKHHRVESAYGSFARSFVVPEDVVADRIAADYKDGVLSVHLPKADIPKVTGKTIKVD